MKFIKILLVSVFLLIPTTILADEPYNKDKVSMELPPEVRAWCRNPDGSCVQCSIVMCGLWNNNMNASTLLWDTEYGPAIRGGSYPSRVAKYAKERGLRIYNITGSSVYDWMNWSAKTGRFAAIGAGSAHFQTLYSKDFKNNVYGVCNNNSTHKIDEYSERGFRNLHEASGQWCVILMGPSPPAIPRYIQWWEDSK